MDYGKWNDSELVAALRRGDSLAFEEIYRRYGELLYLFAYRKLNNEAEAQDVVHDVFAWLLEHGRDLNLKTTLANYLYKSVLNKVFDIFRKQDTFRRYVDQGNHFIDVDSAETDYLIREKDIQALIDREIAGMPPRMREAYELRYREHLSNEQIGDKLGITTQTAATHVKHATKHLRDKFGLVVFVLYVLNQ